MNRVDPAPRILFTANTAWCLYNFRAKPMQGLSEAGYAIAVLAPKDEYWPKLTDMGVSVHEIPIDSRGTNPLRDLATFFRFWRAFRRQKPALVFNYTIKSVIYGSLAARICGIPSIAVISGLGYTFINRDWRSAISKRLYRFALRFPDEVWFLNHDDHEVFQSENLIGNRPVHVLDGEGVDTVHFAPRETGGDGGGPVFLMISRLYWDKGVREFVEAAAEVHKTHPEARFHILGPLGDVAASAVPAETVKRWEDAGHIRHLGSTTDVRPHIAAADCVVLPSYREGLSRSLLEAASMGRPIITTDVVGCREVVDHGVNGLLCRRADSADLAARMREFLDLPESRRKEMGAAGRAKVLARFDVDLVVRMYLERVAALLDRRS